MRRNLSKPALISLIWKVVQGKQPWVLNVLVPEFDALLAKIMHNMKEIGVGIEKSTKKE